MNMNVKSLVTAAVLTLAATSAVYAQQADNGPSPAARARIAVSQKAADTTAHATPITGNKTRAQVRGEVAHAKVDSAHAHVVRDL
jgi:hypothetical protein